MKESLRALLDRAVPDPQDRAYITAEIELLEMELADVRWDLDAAEDRLGGENTELANLEAQIDAYAALGPILQGLLEGTGVYDLDDLQRVAVRVGLVSPFVRRAV